VRVTVTVVHTLKSPSTPEQRAARAAYMRAYRAKRRERSRLSSVILLEELNRCKYEQGERDNFLHREAKHRASRARYMRAYRLRKRRERIEAGEEPHTSVRQNRALEPKHSGKPRPTLGCCPR
jgi:hypothetical protein